LNIRLYACQVFGRSMLLRDYGRIVNMASLATFVGFQEVAAYGASKAAVRAILIGIKFASTIKWREIQADQGTLGLPH
jgi:short-subunit dehydrogenase